MRLIIFILLGNIIAYIAITTVIDTCLLGMLGLYMPRRCDRKEFIVRDNNRIDIQKGFMCSAFSVAYILRHYGMEADGADIYGKMPHMMKDGCVYPKGLKKVLQQYGFSVRYCTGGLNALQREICKAHPVIVMMRVRKDRKWLHYVPVVGFDERYIYIAESLPELVNCDGINYNRRVRKNNFKQLWNTAMLKQPLYKNTFFIIDSKEG